MVDFSNKYPLGAPKGGRSNTASCSLARFALSPASIQIERDLGKPRMWHHAWTSGPTGASTGPLLSVRALWSNQSRKQRRGSPKPSIFPCTAVPSPMMAASSYPESRRWRSTGDPWLRAVHRGGAPAAVRLMPVMRKIGIPQPRVEVYPAYNVNLFLTRPIELGQNRERILCSSISTIVSRERP